MVSTSNGDSITMFIDIVAYVGHYVAACHLLDVR